MSSLLMWRIRTPDDTGDDTPINGNDAFVEMLMSMIGEVITVHHGHMSEISVDGDEASGVWSMEDHLWWPPQYGLGHMWGCGWYEETYRRRRRRPMADCLDVSAPDPHRV